MTEPPKERLICRAWPSTPVRVAKGNRFTPIIKWPMSTDHFWAMFHCAACVAYLRVSRPAMRTAHVPGNAATTGVHQADRRRCIGVQIAEDCHRRILAERRNDFRGFADGLAFFVLLPSR